MHMSYSVLICIIPELSHTLMQICESMFSLKCAMHLMKWWAEAVFDVYKYGRGPKQNQSWG